MRDADWIIEREGRAWRGDEFPSRIDLLPEKLEVYRGRLLWSDDERIKLLGLLLENVGVDRAVRLGDAAAWRAAIADLPSHESALDKPSVPNLDGKGEP